jgi:hypothetical protein
VNEPGDSDPARYRASAVGTEPRSCPNAHCGARFSLIRLYTVPSIGQAAGSARQQELALSSQPVGLVDAEESS